jgi:hypothetical protein
VNIAAMHVTVFLPAHKMTRAHPAALRPHQILDVACNHASSIMTFHLIAEPPNTAMGPLLMLGPKITEIAGSSQHMSYKCKIDITDITVT